MTKRIVISLMIIMVTGAIMGYDDTSDTEWRSWLYEKKAVQDCLDISQMRETYLRLNKNDCYDWAKLKAYPLFAGHAGEGGSPPTIDELARPIFEEDCIYMPVDCNDRAARIQWMPHGLWCPYGDEHRPCCAFFMEEDSCYKLYVQRGG